MRNFIEQIQKSIFNPEYYRDLLTRPATFSWKYYWSLTMLLTVFMTIVSSIPLVPLITTTLRDLPTEFFDYYPDELEVRVVNGQVTSNVEEPYFFSIPSQFSEGVSSTSEFRYLGVIDTTATATLDQFKDFHVGFWLTGDAFMIAEEGGGVKINPIPRDISVTVNETMLRQFVDLAQPYFPFVAPVTVVVIFIAMFLWLTLNLLYLVIAALLIMLLGHIMKKGWGYGTSYRIALHATTLPLLFTVALGALPIGGVTLPLFPTLILLTVVYVNYRDTTPQESESSPPLVTGT